MTTTTTKSHDSSVGIALGYRLDDQDSRVWFPAGAGNFSLHHHIQNSSGAHPTSYPMGTRGSSLGVKWSGREADCSPPSSAKVKEWVELYLHFPRDNFTFTTTTTTTLKPDPRNSRLHFGRIRQDGRHSTSHPKNMWGLCRKKVD
jgi:hypothetical protein